MSEVFAMNIRPSLFIRVIAFVLVLAGAGVPIQSAGAAGSLEDGAKQFIESLADQAVKSLTSEGTPRETRIERFRKMFNDNFDTRTIGQWVLGRNWNTASEEQRTEFLKLFEDLMVVSYVDRFAKYTGESLKITQSLKGGDNDAAVSSRIDNPGGQPVRVDWRVIKKDSAYKIIDVVVEGTSMSTTLRSDFGSIIRQQGGKIEGLLQALREKTKSLL